MLEQEHRQERARLEAERAKFEAEKRELDPADIRSALKDAQKDGKRAIRMRVKSGDATKFVALRLGQLLMHGRDFLPGNRLLRERGVLPPTRTPQQPRPQLRSQEEAARRPHLQHDPADDVVLVTWQVPDDARTIRTALRLLSTGRDVGVVLNGAIADSAYTFGIGSVEPEAQRLLDTCQDALAAGIAAARAGNRIGDISFAVQSVVEGAGFSVVRSLVGHGFVGARIGCGLASGRRRRWIDGRRRADDPDADGDLSGLALVQRELGGTVMTEYDNG